MKRILGLTALVLSLVMTLCSCSLTNGDYVAYMTAPKAAGEMSAVADAFYDFAGEKVTLSYPARGDYLSAFTLEDIDGDGLREAVVFYTSDKDENGVAPVHINIVDKRQGEWRSVADAVTTSNAVDMLSFADISGNGIKEMVVGLTSVTKNENSLNLYTYQDSRLSLMVQETYTDFILSDLTENGCDDLLVVNLKTAEKESTAKLYTVSNNELLLNGAVYLDSNVTGYAKLQESTVGGKKAVYIDAYKGTTSMVTDIVYVENGVLKNPFVTSADTENEFTLRSLAEPCKDYDGDGVLDIPFTRLLPGFELRVNSERAYLTIWRGYDGALFHDKVCGYFNQADGYMMKYPTEWLDTVTITRDSSSHMLTFGVYDPILGTVSSELVRIKRYTVEDYKQIDTSMFVELGTNENYVYVARIVNTTSEYSVDGETLKSMFSLL